MAAFTTTFINDGDEATALSVNQGFSDAQTFINALGRESSRRGAFNHRQGGNLPKLFAGGSFSLSGGDSGAMVFNDLVFGTSLRYASFGADGGTDTAGSYTGDRACVGHPDVVGGYSDGLARITYTSGFKVGMANGDYVAAVLVLGNLQFRRADKGTTGTGVEVMLCVQYKLDNGNWYTIDESERFVSLDDHRVDPTNQSEWVEFDIPVATLLTTGVVSEHGNPTVNKVMGFRLMTSIYTTSGNAASVTHQRWRLTAIPLHAKI